MDTLLIRAASCLYWMQKEKLRTNLKIRPKKTKEKKPGIFVCPGKSFNSQASQHN